MQIYPLKKRILKFLAKHGIAGRFEKRILLFSKNPFHPSLHTEVLEPKHFNIYSFRITRNFRAIFIYRGSSSIEIIDINNHYQ